MRRVGREAGLRQAQPPQGFFAPTNKFGGGIAAPEPPPQMGVLHRDRSTLAQLLDQAGLAAGGVVLVDDALDGSLIEQAQGCANGRLIGRATED